MQYKIQVLSYGLDDQLTMQYKTRLVIYGCTFPLLDFMI